MENFEKHERLTIKEDKHLIIEEHILKDYEPLHWHSFFEIEIVLSGMGDCIINQSTYPIPSFNVFLLNSTDFHSYYAHEETRFINISFDSEIISEADVAALMFSRNDKAYHLDNDSYERLIAAARLLLHEYECDGECQRELLHYIIHTVLKKNAANTKSEIELKHSRGIKNAIIFTEMHFRENIRLTDAAKASGYAPAYFSELYKRATGESYSESLCRLRLANACTMLANGFSVSDSCYLSGFGSLSNFLEVFKKKHGVPPSQYKKNKN